MNEIEKLIGLPQKITMWDMEIEVYPLIYEDLALLTSSNRDFGETVKKCIKKSFPDITEDQMKQIPIGFINEFMLQVYKVSGMKVDQKKLDQMMAELKA